MAVLNAERDLLDSVSVISFDDSGKHVAIGGKGGAKITTVKEWGTTSSLGTGEESVSGIAWVGTGIVTCSDKKRLVRFFGKES